MSRPLDPSRLRPALRALEPRAAEHEGRPGLLLLDPLGLIEGPVFVPDALVPILVRLDGTRTLRELGLELRAAGASVDESHLTELVEQLDEGLLLHSPLFQTTLNATADAFLATGSRGAAHAGSHGYPADPSACSTALDAMLGPFGGALEPPLRGLIAPHIDLGRGASGYRAAYQAFASRAFPDLVVVFGTGHGGPAAPLTGLPLDWQTPLGTLRTDRAFVEAVHARIGAAQPADLLLHRREHSLEFQMLCLAAISRARTGRPDSIPVAGFLCGSLPCSEGDPDREDWLRPVLAALREVALAAGRRVTFLAGADLAHVGPRFGDAAPIDTGARASLAVRDRERLAELAVGAPGRFHAAVTHAGNPDRVCSATAIYLAAKLAGGRAELLEYGQAADDDGAECVSWCAAQFPGTGP